jgi:hypothetical protein
MLGNEMSEVEALLNVDAGRVPPGAIAFFPRDPEALQRRVCTFFAIVALAAGVGLALGTHSRAGVALLALVGVAFAVGALPTRPDVDEQPTKRPTLLLTAEGLIVRDDCGLRTWSFDDLADVRPYMHLRTLGLLVVRKDGKRDFIDTMAFERGDRVPELIGRRLKPREA